MSAELLATAKSPDVVRTSWHRPTVLALGLKEARRMLLSPVYLIPVLVMAPSIGLQRGALSGPGSLSAANVYVGISYVVLLWAGLLVYAAAHLVTSSARRSHAERLLAAVPATQRQRGIGLCLGVVLGPGLLVAAVAGFLAWLGTRFMSSSGGERPLSVAELSHLPLLVVGGGLFGVLVATWLRFPGSLPLGLVSLVFVTVWMSAEQQPVALHWLAPFTTADQVVDESWTYVGSQVWHAVYLGCLGALGVCAVALRQREGRGRWLVASVVMLALTVVAGVAQQ